MLKSLLVGISLSITLSTVPAWSQDDASDVVAAAKVCAAIDKKKDRLACYDRLFKASATPVASNKPPNQPRQVAKQPETPKPTAKAKPPAVTPKTAPSKTDAEEDKFGKSRREVEKKELQQIESRITSIIVGKKSNRARFYLENGQIWDSREVVPRRLLKEGKNVLIKKGSFGGYRIIIEGSSRGFNVRRRK